MWKIVYIASSKKEAENISEIMESEGFLIKFISTGAGNYQIQVPALEAEDAYSCLHKNF